MTSDEAIDTGDTVHHQPTGETWVVACVEGDRLYWAGWPYGTALLSDCALAERATPEQRIALLRDCAKMEDQNDYRCRRAKASLQAEGLL